MNHNKDHQPGERKADDRKADDPANETDGLLPPASPAGQGVFEPRSFAVVGPFAAYAALTAIGVYGLGASHLLLELF